MQREQSKLEKTEWAGPATDILLEKEGKLVLNLEKTKTSIMLKSENKQGKAEITPKQDNKLKICINGEFTECLKKEKFLKELREEVAERLKIRPQKITEGNKGILATLLHLKSLPSNIERK